MRVIRPVNRAKNQAQNAQIEKERFTLLSVRQKLNTIVNFVAQPNALSQDQSDEMCALLEWIVEKSLKERTDAHWILFNLFPADHAGTSALFTNLTLILHQRNEPINQRILTLFRSLCLQYNALDSVSVLESHFLQTLFDIFVPETINLSDVSLHADFILSISTLLRLSTKKSQGNVLDQLEKSPFWIASKLMDHVIIPSQRYLIHIFTHQNEISSPRITPNISAILDSLILNAPFHPPINPILVTCGIPLYFVKRIETTTSHTMTQLILVDMSRTLEHWSDHKMELRKEPLHTLALLKAEGMDDLFELRYVRKQYSRSADDFDDVSYVLKQILKNFGTNTSLIHPYEREDNEDEEIDMDDDPESDRSESDMDEDEQRWDWRFSRWGPGNTTGKRNE
ncbi:hypothetical protein BLNAU_6296 [Blattamonas nauphoetae]|uniref:Uncharacterized protein n=1 Tax=Blattamonas nauphoetae TaxID=2049346 RepID=A0ABQ9Y523_9EUKA|nr:hypothetical protein BLNAU_6296 [Blattamonas nauphoetae]